MIRSIFQQSVTLHLQSPWGVATGAIAGHLFATSIAILGGAILANYISEKLVAATYIYIYIWDKVTYFFLVPY